MEAKDTVLTTDGLLTAGVDFNKEIRVWLGQSLKAQAEISFKAGIKEVVGWINDNADLEKCDPDTVTAAWQAKLKEWGIN